MSNSQREIYFGYVTWDQAQFERFSYILSKGYRWNLNLFSFRLARRNVIFKINCIYCSGNQINYFALTLDRNMELAEFKISRFITSFVHDQMLAYVVHSSYTSLCHSRCHTWVVSCFNLRPGYSCVGFCSFCKSFYITGTSKAKWRALHIWRERAMVSGN